MIAHSPELPETPEDPAALSEQVVSQEQRNAQHREQCRALIARLPEPMQEEQLAKLREIETRAADRKEEERKRLVKDVEKYFVL